MTRYQNLHLADRPVFLQYRTLFKADMSQARALLSDPQLETKLFRAENINDISDNIDTLENYYYDNIPEYLNLLLANFNSSISDLEYVGEYSATTTYNLNNVVSYNSGLYYCKNTQGATNILPTDTNSWLNLGLRGEQGFPGLGVTLNGVWNSSTTYLAKSVVEYDDFLYVSTQPSTGEIPSETSSYWSIFMKYEHAKINLTEDNLENGDIYWQEITNQRNILIGDILEGKTLYLYFPDISEMTVSQIQETYMSDPTLIHRKIIISNGTNTGKISLVNNQGDVGVRESYFVGIWGCFDNGYEYIKEYYTSIVAGSIGGDPADWSQPVTMIDAEDPWYKLIKIDG